MQKNEFEKQVRQKMDELKIDPSGSVWQNIEVAITKKRRRRGWIFFPVVFTGLLWGIYFLLNQGTAPAPGNQKTAKNLSGKAGAVSYEDTISKTSIVQKDSFKIKAGKGDLKNIPRLKQDNKTFSAGTGRNNYKDLVNQVQYPRVAATPLGSNNLPEKSPYEVKNSKAPEMDKPDAGKNLIPGYPAGMPEENKMTVYPGDATTGLIQIDRSPAKIKNAVPLKQADSSSIQVTDTTGRYSQEKDKIVAGNPIKHTKPALPKNPWKWGLNFSAGISGVPTGFLGSLDKSYGLADALYASTPSQGPGNPAVYPSPIRSSGALIAGFFLEKNISGKKMIMLGLNYKRFGTTNTVGQINNSTRGYQSVNPVNTYHNHYHFIELPVSLKIPLNDKKIPLSWDAGISVTRLVASDALQFNSSTGEYTVKNSLFNKTQAGFNTGISVTFFSRQKTTLSIGPYFYYGTTKVAAEGLYKNQHFTFIGLRSHLTL